LHYAIVHKTRKNGRVVRVEPRVIFGNPDEVLALLARSPVSRKVNTAFVERNNGTDRNRNARKVRRTYCFSKDWDIHERFTYLHILQLQLLLAGAHASLSGRNRTLAQPDTGYVRRTGRSRLVIG
jgi:hypothetical protein